MNFLIFLEYALLFVGAWLIWRRTRAMKPDGNRPFGLLLLALLSQLVLLLLADPLLGWLKNGADPTDRLTATALGIAAIQVLRTLLLAWAIQLWLVIVRPRLVRSWRGVLILLSLIFITFVPGATTGFCILMILPMARLHWTDGIHGWKRTGTVIVLGLLAFALTAGVTMTMSEAELSNVRTNFSNNRTLEILAGDLPNPAASIGRAARPLGNAIRVSATLLHLQIAIGFFQLLVLPIRLRGLSLKRRFTVAFAMYRLIPGTLAFIFMILVVYLGIGLHRATVVRHTFEKTLGEGMRTAQMLDSALPEYTPGYDRRIMHRSESWATQPSDQVVAIVRELEWVTHTDSTSDETTERWITHEATASTHAPQDLIDSDFFTKVAGDSAIGLVASNGVLYLRSARLRQKGERRVGSEVFVAVDVSYLTRITGKIQSDIRIEVSPNVFIRESGVTIGNTPEGADSAFSLDVPYIRDIEKDDFWERKFYLARTFIPIGNWLESLAQNNSIGAIQLKLYTSPRGLLESINNSALAITSQAFAILIFATIGLLFLILELSAVRTGRSIMKGIVTDVKNLSEAAKKFGKGDLTHRVELSGGDEMGQLAATFNTMATNIEAHQEVLLEKERLEADLSVARDIQQRMLPQSAPDVPGLDVAGLSIPSREVGGDLFYFLPVANGRLGLTIGDVSGKSIPAALLMSNVLAALKTEARLVEGEDEILGHLNRLIVDQVEPGRFVTFFYGVADPANRSLRYACAGHNPPLIMRASGEAEWLKEAGLPLGLAAETEYQAAEEKLESGDVLVLYSDGVTEAQRATPDVDEDTAPAEDEFFDEHRLESAVRNVRDQSATEIIARVMDAVRAFTDGAEQSDDLTLVVIRIV